MIYVRAIGLAAALAAIMGAATYAVMGLEVIPFGIPREVWAVAVALFVFAFTVRDQIERA